MVVAFLVKSLFVFKHLMARFETTDIGSRWHEAALAQPIIPYCAREFIELWYNIRNAWLLNIMFNFIHYTNIFGQNTTQLFAMLFPSPFFIYNHTRVLVSQSSFNTITVCMYYKGFCAYMFICNQHIVCFRNI